MILVYLAVLIYSAEWVLYPLAEWIVLLGTKNIIVALLATSLFNFSLRFSLFERSVLLLVALTAWCDVIVYFILQLGIKTDLSAVCAILFFMFLIHSLKREYPEFIDNPNSETVNILICNPKTNIDVFKALLGFPSSAICILAGGYVWSFKKKSGKYEKFIASQEWIDSHLIINTGIFATRTIIKELESNLGKSRFPFCKCIWSIRNVLNMLGGKYRIVSWFDYVPGIYIFRVLRG